ncbi:hypothetical protein H4R18_005528 [Coemansia javaensis]|uniref:Uncharacterized protein n=1 Tax=Coemansia javaensis TaxID=2761396 RepID=A0A9W8LF75_9FUNG|nr:hypothetical protein H4R18_005528 [Coemansia javaensis]
MKLFVIASALAMCALAANSSPLKRRFTGDIDQDGLEDTDSYCKKADGTTVPYVQGGDYALLSPKYMAGNLGTANCGRCIKVTNDYIIDAAGNNVTQASTVVLTVLGACEGCIDDNLFTGSSTVKKLGGAARFIDEADWSFVDCPK